MPLRLLEATVPNDALDRFPELIEEFDIVQCAKFGPGEPGGLVRILLETGESEPVSDKLVRHFGTDPVFRIVLHSIEATFPAPPEPEKPPPEAAQVAPRRKKLKRVSRDELQHDITAASRLTGIYAIMVLLSTVVAVVGLVRGDTAIIIGAMVIAPLLGPNMGMALAAALGARELASQSFKAITVGVLIALALSMLMGALIDFDPTEPAIMARTQPGVGDIMLALSAGAAGALAFTSGVPGVLVGVMVAVALLPPLVVAGLLAGAGLWPGALGAMMLCLTNVTCINLSAMSTFYLQDITPRTWWEANRAKRATRRAGLAWVILLGLLAAIIVLRQQGLL